MTRIAWATGRAFVDADADLPLLDAAATAAGIDSEPAFWDDPDVDWSAYDLVIVRSCWDYVPRREEFLAWAERVPRLMNPAEVLRWNTDKTYLRALAERGVRVLDTRWSVREGDDLGTAREWVVKPAISAGSADTARYADPVEVYRHSERLLAAGRTSMVQPYVASVDEEGETGLLFFGGRFSHAFRKGALLVAGSDARVDPELEEDIRAREPSAEQVAFGEGVLAAATTILGATPLYARIDVVTDDDAGLALMELELTEPSFFLDHTDSGSAGFIDEVVRLLP